jgi:fumarylacetoacetate (FAA) hydrolase
MRLVSFFPLRDTEADGSVAGVLTGGLIVDLSVVAHRASLDWGGEDLDLGEMLRYGVFERAEVESLAAEGALDHRAGRSHEGHALAYAEESVDLDAPIPVPTSLRDFYAFEQHVKAARARRGLEMIPEWYELPVFYFSNHNAVIGPEDAVLRPRASAELDFELEIACVIETEGIDLTPDQAESHILGYTIMNDWSARDLQRAEMKMNLGPAKGKDFATSLGPWVVTLDELRDRAVGNGRYDLGMFARINGMEVSEANFADITHAFPHLLARASADVWLQPGDVIGSGTAGTGCILELGPENVPWLQPGDVVELEIDELGVLRNVVEAPED